MAKKAGGKGSGEPDELEVLKASILAKELEVFTVRDKMRRLEDKTHLIEQTMVDFNAATKERFEKLTDIINYLTSEGISKDKRINQLEQDLAKAEQDKKDTIERSAKEMKDMTGAHEFALNSMKLQLEAATVKLREMHEFSLRKKAMEEELAGLKEQIHREQRDHAEAISDVERVSVQDKERLKKEILKRVEETKKEMIKVMEEQLHSKTKKTISENEQLRKEVAYHTHQTDLLIRQNEKLLVDANELNRGLILGKELEDELARSNHMYQKTTRILVFKLREKQLSSSQEQKTEQEKKDEEDLKELLKRTEQLKTPPPSDHQGPLDAKARARDEAIRFLYACLEDVELERIAKTPVDSFTLSHDSSSAVKPDLALDQLSLKQRQGLLKNLLHQAVSLRSMTDNMVGMSDYRQSPYSVGSHASAKGEEDEDV